MRYATLHSAGLALALTSALCVQETDPPDVQGENDLPGDSDESRPADDFDPDAPASDTQLPTVKQAGDAIFTLAPQSEDAVARAENRDGYIATALAMYQTGQSRATVCNWLAQQCPQSIGTAEKAAKALAGHNAGF